MLHRLELKGSIVNLAGFLAKQSSFSIAISIWTYLSFELLLPLLLLLLACWWTGETNPHSPPCSLADSLDCDSEQPPPSSRFRTNLSIIYGVCACLFSSPAADQGCLACLRWSPAGHWNAPIRQSLESKRSCNDRQEEILLSSARLSRRCNYHNNQVISIFYY